MRRHEATSDASKGGRTSTRVYLRSWNTNLYFKAVYEEVFLVFSQAHRSFYRRCLHFLIKLYLSSFSLICRTLLCSSSPVNANKTCVFLNMNKQVMVEREEQKVPQSAWWKALWFILCQSRNKSVSSTSWQMKRYSIKIRFDPTVKQTCFVVSGWGSGGVQEDGGAGGGPGAVVVWAAGWLEQLPEGGALRDQRPPQTSTDQRRYQHQEQRAAQRQTWQ